MSEDRVALDTELGILHRVPVSEENQHFVIGRPASASRAWRSWTIARSWWTTKRSRQRCNNLADDLFRPEVCYYNL